jgi:hypothetical protein
MLALPAMYRRMLLFVPSFFAFLLVFSVFGEATFFIHVDCHGDRLVLRYAFFAF